MVGLACWRLSLWDVSPVFHQLNEATLFATLKFHCQSLSSLKDRFCRLYKAYLVLRCWKHSALLEQDYCPKKQFSCDRSLSFSSCKKWSTKGKIHSPLSIHLFLKDICHTVQITCKPVLICFKASTPLEVYSAVLASLHTSTSMQYYETNGTSTA